MKLTKFCRFLPDKAIDLVDEACSKLRLQQESKPEALENLDRQIMTIQIELESLKKETDSLSADRRKKLEEDLKQKQQESEKLSGRWQEERYYNAYITHTVHSVHPGK
jgi:ATP-dependent Clp protease ATP-binding subunit ClpB